MKRVQRGYTVKIGDKGFTYMELVFVIIALSVLAFSIGVRFNKTEIGSAVAADQLIADIRYMQMKAISIGQPYKITFSGGNSYSISRKDESEKETKKLPNDETAIADICGTLSFNTLGEPNMASNCTITLSGGSKIIVYSITGKAELI